MPYLEIVGAEIFYQARGHGPLALFLHGFGLDHTMWLDQLADLLTRRRCVAIDLRGFGRSDAAIQAGDSHAADVIAVLDGLGDPADLVGLSLGGHVAIEVASERPDLVRSLTAFGVMAAGDYVPANGRPEAQLTASREAMGIAWAAGMMAPGQDLAKDLAKVARVVAMAAGTSPTALFPAAPMRLGDADERLRRIAAPVLLATGEHDRVTPPGRVEALAQTRPGTDVAVLPGAGHLPPIETPGEVNRLLARFWDQSATSRRTPAQR